ALALDLAHRQDHPVLHAEHGIEEHRVALGGVDAGLLGLPGPSPLAGLDLLGGELQAVVPGVGVVGTARLGPVAGDGAVAPDISDAAALRTLRAEAIIDRHAADFARRVAAAKGLVDHARGDAGRQVPAEYVPAHL